MQCLLNCSWLDQLSQRAYVIFVNLEAGRHSFIWAVSIMALDMKTLI